MALSAEEGGSELDNPQNPMLSDTVEMLEPGWHDNSSHSQEEDILAEFGTDGEMVERSTDQNGDKNIWHVSNGYGYVYEEILDKIVEKNERPNRNWVGRRQMRDLSPENNFGSVLPGMATVEEHMKAETRRENGVRGLNIQYTNAAFTGDDVRLLDHGKSIESQAQAPGSDEWTTTGTISDIEYGDFDSSYNGEIFGVISQMVARRPRDFEMLVETDFRLAEDVNPEELNWDRTERRNEELDEGKMNQYETDVYVDGGRIGSYTEKFVEAAGRKIVEEYEEETAGNYQKAVEASKAGNMPAAVIFTTAGIMNSMRMD